ncbi:MAG TPA: endonuclease/exonuclease/phosphatase family protein [Bacteroidales bacterium]|nr:endonuclease/exonuclease/phosphatase family protein [Bacteroidales bacterium]HQM70928.1 endonuclease/exonuclease/phosphatase family protein [Bacteroidales bacterium]
MMRRILFISLAIFQIVITGCSRETETEPVKVMTFNIRYDNPRDNENAWPNRIPVVCNFLNTEKPDLIGMQEVLYQQYHVLDSALKDYQSVAVGRTDGLKAGEMNPVFFRKERFELIRTKTFWLSETPEIAGSMAWGAGLPRIVTWVELADKKSDRHFFFFNTHFAHDSDPARKNSALLLLTMADSIASGFPLIITGDLNMLPNSEGYSILTGPFESVPLIRDTYTITEESPEGPVYTFNGFSDKPGQGRIDYIFVRDGMRALNHRTIIKKDQGIFISDHWPVTATISFKQND